MLNDVHGVIEAAIASQYARKKSIVLRDRHKKIIEPFCNVQTTSCVKVPPFLFPINVAFLLHSSFFMLDIVDRES